jgi:anti-anti-sigma factor
MTDVLCNTIDSVIFSDSEMTELVRGCEQNFRQRLEPIVRRHSVALDLGNVERIDAAGIAALISLYGLARDAGHRFTICNASERVREILALVGLDQILIHLNATSRAADGSQCQRPAA